ncbi:MAG: DUF4179 domain-containing protein [Coriobacteriaceae bacterium]|jgi:hypothetical protein|nr:DUF4179 domain-containing protein [Coriobacteriaceae bacterium]
MMEGQTDNTYPTTPGATGAKAGLEKLMEEMKMDTLLALEPIAIDTEKVKELAFRRILAIPEDLGHHNAPQGRRSRPMPRRSPTRRLDPTRRKMPYPRMLVAACIVVGSLFVGTAAYAIGSALMVGNNPLDWREKSSYYGYSVPNLDQFNVPIGQTLESDGASVTLDAIAIDDNLVKAFLTYRFNEPIEAYLTEEARSLYADRPDDSGFRWMAMEVVGAPSIDLGGLVLSPSIFPGGQTNLKDTDSYFADDEYRVYKTSVQYLIPEMLPDQLDVTVKISPTEGYYVLKPAVSEPLTFAATIDKGSAAQYTVAFEPGIYEFDIEGVTWKLDLKKFAKTPFGTLICYDTHNDEGLVEETRFIGRGDLRFFDQDGNSYHGISPGSANSGRLMVTFFSDLPESATSLSFCPPIKQPATHDRSYPVTDIGVKMPVTPTRGFYLRDYRIEYTPEGFVQTIVSQPYGFTDIKVDITELPPEAIEFQGTDKLYQVSFDGMSGDFQNDAGDIAPQELLGLQLSDFDPYDPATNLFTQKVRYYSAGEDTLRRIPGIRVRYSEWDVGEDYRYDFAQAKTLTFG